MKSLTLKLAAVALALLPAACRSGRPAAVSPSVIDSDSADGVAVVSVAPANQGLNGTTPDALPKAQIFRVNRVNPAENVPVTLGPDGKSVLSFPAPSDLTGPMALPLDDSYWLDLRGISPDTRYLTLTVSEYCALPADSLTPAFLLAHLADAGWPTQIVRLPFATSEPDAVSRANTLISEGLPDCPITYARPFGRPMR